MKTIIFFNNKGGVGKTTLVYHTSWMLAELGYRCLSVDMDPQANLTSMFLSDDELERIYSAELNRETILSGIKPLEIELRIAAISADFAYFKYTTSIESFDFTSPSRDFSVS